MFIAPVMPLESIILSYCRDWSYLMDLFFVHDCLVVPHEIACSLTLLVMVLGMNLSSSSKFIILKIKLSYMTNHFYCATIVKQGEVSICYTVSVSYVHLFYTACSRFGT